MQTAIQLYTLRDVAKPLAEIVSDVGAAGYDGVEFATRVGDADQEAVRDALADATLDAAGAHVGIDRLETDFEGVLADARRLGYDDVVVPWLDSEHFESGAAVEEAATRLATLADDLATEGLRLHYHNHDQEFARIEDGPAFHRLVDLADGVRFEVDAGWALAGGEDPAALLERYADRITHVHLKDVALGRTESPALGDGDLDVGAAVDAARSIGAEWLIYEDDAPADPETASEHGMAVVSEHR